MVNFEIPKLSKETGLVIGCWVVGFCVGVIFHLKFISPNQIVRCSVHELQGTPISKVTEENQIVQRSKYINNINT